MIHAAWRMRRHCIMGKPGRDLGTETEAEVEAGAEGSWNWLTFCFRRLQTSQA